MNEQALHQFFEWLHRIPGWLWRMAASTGLGGAVFAAVVPWAQAQRGYPSVGGEYILVLAVAVLPLAIFRR